VSSRHLLFGLLLALDLFHPLGVTVSIASCHDPP
jgi:hypothetical protein